MRKNTLLRALALSSTLGVTGTAHAVTWDAGDWTLGLGGNVNAFYTRTNCDASDLDSGGTTLASLACPTDGDKNSVNNGLLPASLNFSAETTQNGFDISAHINVYYGITSSGADGDSNADNTPDALKFSSVDARQVYLTFGNADMGTVKMGRDFGLFAFDAIINDMSLLGAGSAFTTANPGHTTLGGLGYGYVYTDRLAQINWTSPKWGGFQGTVGVFNPFDGQTSSAATKAIGESSLGFHGKASYEWDGAYPGYVSTTFLKQDIDIQTAAGADVGSSDIQGWDIFGKVSIGDFGFAGYYYDGEGMTSLALGGLVFPGFSDTADAEESSGYYVQGTYNWNNTKFGIHWAESEQEELTEVENERLTLGVYHNLTPALTLLGEYSMQESSLSGGGTDKTSSFNVGAILFF